MAKSKEFVTLEKNGTTITVDKALTSEYISAGWRVINDSKNVESKSFNKYPTY